MKKKKYLYERNSAKNFADEMLKSGSSWPHLENKSHLVKQIFRNLTNKLLSVYNKYKLNF